MPNPKFDLSVNHDKLKSCFNFKKDLLLGQAGENYVNKILSDDAVKIEVKKDDWAVRSGNIALEFESRGKPSGILTTEADIWCFVVGHVHVLMMPTNFLRWVLEEGHGTVKAVGDRDRKTGKPTSQALLIAWVKLLELFNDYNKTSSRP